MGRSILSPVQTESFQNLDSVTLQVAPHGHLPLRMRGTGGNRALRTLDGDRLRESPHPKLDPRLPSPSPRSADRWTAGLPRSKLVPCIGVESWVLLGCLFDS